MSISTPETERSSLRVRHRLMDLMDPRSPTTEFQRTPIQIMVKKWNSMSNKTSLTDSGCEASTNDTVESVTNPVGHNENDSTSSSTDVSYVSLDDISLDAIELSDFDLSKMISQLNDSCTIDVDSVAKRNKTSPDLLKTVEDTVQFENEPTPAVECSEIENEMPVKAEMVEPMKKVTKNLFSTPTKKRTPLESVDNVCLSTPPSQLNSPQNSFREKQWKRIHEERKKLGLESNENLPIPLMDVTASAPSKLVYRKRTTDNKVNLSKLL